MRWDNLRLADAEGDASAVPLFARGAVARTFDTPEFKGMTFYEIQAKSIINKVPAASRVPFTHTINPYRGCSHACSYCLAGDTPVLMADGRAKPIAELRAGDRIFGTRLVGGRRRHVVTEVLDHWSTVKAAHRVALADGTRLVASGEHRFLTERGWKHVTGEGARPFLRDGDRLVGCGRFAAPPKQDDDYRRGYLCAILSSPCAFQQEGHPARKAGERALPEEALDRARSYLGHFGADPALPSAGCEPSGLFAVAESPSGEWMKGFVAGCLDAGGEYEADRLRACLSALGFDRLDTSPASTRFGEDPAPAALRGDPAPIALRGGPAAWLRLLHTVDPAVPAPHALEGAVVESAADLRVVSVEPLGVETPMYDITTGTGDFIADGVVSHNCFARKTHEYLDLDAGHDFDSKIVVKVNAAELARKELASPRWGGHHVAMGTNVDCYQRAEGRYRLMPGILRALTEAANPFSILTKGTLILRDLPLLVEAARVSEVSAAFSVGFVDERLWRAVEPGTPHPRRRLEACRRITDSGIACGVLMAPILPYLSDSPEQLEAAVREIAASGATHVTPIVLHLRPGAREWFLGWLSREHPRLVPRYLELYGRGAYAPKAYQERVSTQVRELARQYGIGRRASWRIQPDKPPPPEQLSLL
ncbi:intein-containing Rv2578c family radical SAM protein [Nonomuraea dietziae]|uniref:intein-containing Rv2578c family radical SAM protein n=1 Tax=Nonomuraea dietziae TaxID=65515 RepID=UPI0031D1D105